MVGLLIAAATLGVLRSAVRQAGARLMDAAGPGLVDQARAALGTVEALREPHHAEDHCWRGCSPHGGDGAGQPGRVP